jgi:hypothetical protein
LQCCLASADAVGAVALLTGVLIACTSRRQMCLRSRHGEKMPQRCHACKLCLFYGVAVAQAQLSWRTLASWKACPKQNQLVLL